jgi:hypothetical protein
MGAAEIEDTVEALPFVEVPVAFGHGGFIAVLINAVGADAAGSL